MTLGLGVADEILELGRRVGGVERVVDGADLEGREVEVDAGKRLLDLHHDTIAGLQPERLQCRRGTSDLIEQLGVGQDAPVGRLERGRVFRRAHLGFQASEKIAVAWHLADRPSGRASSSQQQRGHRGDTEARMRCGRRGKRWLKDFPGAEPEAGVYTGAWPRGNTAIGWCRSKALPDRGFEGRAKPWDIPLCAGRTALLQQASQVFFQLSTERVTALGPSANRRASRSPPSARARHEAQDGVARPGERGREMIDAALAQAHRLHALGRGGGAGSRRRGRRWPHRRDGARGNRPARARPPAPARRPARGRAAWGARHRRSA